MHSKYRSDTSINAFEALTAYSRRNHRGTRAEYFNVVSIFYTSIISRYHSLTWLNLNRSTDRPSHTSQHFHYIQADRVILAHQLDTAYSNAFSPTLASVINMVHASAVEEFKKDDVELTVPPSEPRPILIIVMVRAEHRHMLEANSTGSRILVCPPT